MSVSSITDLIETFELLEDWEDRYGLIIDMGRDLPPMDDALRNDESRVEGCVSKVWLVPQVEEDAAGDQVLRFIGDSDAMIVKGLIAILFTLFSGKTAKEILAINPESYLIQLDLTAHLSPSRSNGLYAMIGRIKDIAGRTEEHA